MKLFHPNSRYGIVCLLSDLILNQINKVKNYNTVIQVTDCNNFFVINGQTDSKELLNLELIKKSLKNDYNDLCNWDSKMNFIDLIHYGVKSEKPSQISIGNLYYSERPIYSQEQINHYRNHTGFLFNEQHLSIHVSSEKSINNTLAISSFFPFGYSYSMGRDLLYYSEYIMYNLSGIANFDMCSIDYEITNDDINFTLSGNSYLKISLFESVIKDYFNFDLSRFETNNYLGDLLDPFGPKPWLVKDIKSEIVII
jgi:hypothetical protein